MRRPKPRSPCMARREVLRNIIIHRHRPSAVREDGDRRRHRGRAPFPRTVDKRQLSSTSVNIGVNIRGRGCKHGFKRRAARNARQSTRRRQARPREHDPDPRVQRAGRPATKRGRPRLIRAHRHTWNNTRTMSSGNFGENLWGCARFPITIRTGGDSDAPRSSRKIVASK